MPHPADLLISPLREEVGRLGFDLVDVQVTGSVRRRSLRLRIDWPEETPGAGISSEDCTRVTRALLRWFPERFPDEQLDHLEVSSPGLERPVRWPAHWRRFVGERVRVRAPSLPGRPVAVILDVPDDEHVVLDITGAGPRTLALAEIREATLVVDWSRYGNSRSGHGG